MRPVVLSLPSQLVFPGLTIVISMGLQNQIHWCVSNLTRQRVFKNKWRRFSSSRFLSFKVKTYSASNVIKPFLGSNEHKLQLKASVFVFDYSKHQSILLYCLCGTCLLVVSCLSAKIRPARKYLADLNTLAYHTTSNVWLLAQYS